MTQTRLMTAIYFAILGGLCGCGKVDDPAADTFSNVAKAEPPFRMATQIASLSESDGAIEYDTKFTQDPNLDQIREQFAKIDWRASNGSSVLKLNRGDRGTPAHIGLGITGSLEPSDERKRFRAEWAECEPGSTKLVEHKAFLSSTDTALELLLSFYAQDDRYRLMVDWVED